MTFHDWPVRLARVCVTGGTHGRYNLSLSLDHSSHLGHSGHGPHTRSAFSFGATFTNSPLSQTLKAEHTRSVVSDGGDVSYHPSPHVSVTVVHALSEVASPSLALYWSSPHCVCSRQTACRCPSSFRNVPRGHVAHAPADTVDALLRNSPSPHVLCALQEPSAIEHRQGTYGGGAHARVHAYE